MSTAKISAATPDDLAKGKWAQQFEHVFGEVLPVFNPSRSFWGKTEYAVFGQGRKGVVVGKDGWLFSDEEFSCPPRYKQNFAGNLAYISLMKKTLAVKNTRLVLLLVPAKVRVNQQHLPDISMPSCRAALYQETLDGLNKANIPVANALQEMKAQNNNDLYLKTDTHWTPEGARLAAQILAAAVAKEKLDGDIEKKEFTTEWNGDKSHEGDLLRYLPSVRSETLKPDRLSLYTTSAAGDADLFGDSAPPVTLVGTSYSANPAWNFEGFLKQALHADILNMADQGLGPFTVMDKYLADKSAKDAPPKLLIWEIPERYMLFPHKIANNL